MLNRRGLLGVAALSSAALGSAGLAACGTETGPDSGDTSGDQVQLRLGWWGNPTRNQNTTDVIEAYTSAHSEVSITPEPGDWSGYWDRLATQTAADDMPDIIQMDMAYIREYGDRGALLDLAEHGLDTSEFAEGTADQGQSSNGLAGITAGVNSPVLLANPAIFEAAGVELPDDETWTWDDLREVAVSVTQATDDGIWGLSGSVGGSEGLEFWLRQAGRALYTEEGLNFTADDVVPFFDWLMTLYDTQASPPASVTVEDQSKSQDQQLLVSGKVAMMMYWSNQVAALDKSTGEDLQILRLPSATGNFADSQYWYKASMLWSASARTENPEAAVQLIDFLVNQPEAAKIIKAERGMPPNLEMRQLIRPDLSASDQKAADFLDAIEPAIAPAPIPPLPGNSAVGDALSRQITDMIFGDIDPATAAQNFFTEAQTAVSQ